jgi:predicted GIY-YIG superfamily endonuclease
MQEVFLSDILVYKIKPIKGYSLGGFYLIENTQNGFKYVGRSIDYMARLKQHIKIHKPKTLIDIALKSDLHKFKFYLISTYNEHSIDFFTRKSATTIEHNLISKYDTFNPKGYNNVYYGHL